MSLKGATWKRPGGVACWRRWRRGSPSESDGKIIGKTHEKWDIYGDGYIINIFLMGIWGYIFVFLRIPGIIFWMSVFGS